MESSESPVYPPARVFVTSPPSGWRPAVGWPIRWSSCGSRQRIRSSQRRAARPWWGTCPSPPSSPHAGPGPHASPAPRTPCLGEGDSRSGPSSHTQVSWSLGPRNPFPGEDIATSWRFNCSPINTDFLEKIVKRIPSHNWTFSSIWFERGSEM